MINRYIFLFLFITLSIGLIAYTTPIAIPDGFPFVAKTVSSDELNKSANSPAVKFVDSTLEKGIYFIHQQGDERLSGIDESLGSGACAADFNNDNWVDLFLVNGSGHTRYYGKEYWWQESQGNALLINEHGQNFKNVGLEKGIDKKIWGMGCLAADLDNDGDIDLLITGKEDILLYRNEGSGEFSDVTRESGLVSGFWSTSVAAADFNSDGLLDIYVGNFIDFRKGAKTFEANSQFAAQQRNTFDASLYRAQANRLYLNRGGLKFKDITDDAGVSGADGRTLDVSWQDINRDGLPDLLVTNDRGTGSNTFYLNQGGEKFETTEQVFGLRSALGNRGIASGDLDNDGALELVIASAHGENTVALFNQQNTVGETDFKDHARDIGIAANQYLYLSGWTPIIEDFNNDGHNDVFLGAGMLVPDPDAAKVAQGQHNQLLLNNGDGFYLDATRSSGISLLDSQSTRGVAAADFDNDGDIDLYVSNNNDMGQYLVNETPVQHWLGLRLIGTRSNKDAIGARVELISPGKNQIKTVVSGEGFLSDSDKRIVFGLGDQAIVERLIIQWPSGHKQLVNVPSIDRYWVIEEGATEPKQLTNANLTGMVKQNLDLKLGIENVEVRIGYLNLLVGSAPDSRAWRELAIALEDRAPEVRRAVIDIASRFNSVQGLNLLVRALEDDDTENVVAAITGLKNYEDEASIRWLLRSFLHHDSAVKVALADCFSHFFQEEEAVVHRKYLAVPHLIKLLDDPVSQVRIAAARALAAAERYRGLHSLQDHLRDPDPYVRAEVVRSIGLIRQINALPLLKELLRDPAQQANVIANIFIALKRLGDENTLNLLDSYIRGQNDFQTLDLTKRLEVLAELLAQQHESTVFGIEKLHQITLAMFQERSASESESYSLTKNRIRIWENVWDVVGEQWLDRQTHSSQPELRLLAFKALSTRPQTQILRRAWADQDVAIKQWALEKRLRAKQSLTKEDYQTIVSNEALRDVSAKVWSEKGLSGHVSSLIEALLDKPSKNSASMKPDSHFGKRSSDKQSVRFDELNAICAEPGNALAFCPLILFSENSVEHRDMAAKILRDRSASTAIRRKILNGYDKSFDPDAINVLYPLAQSKKDLLRAEVLQKLFSFDDDSLNDFANKIANNANQDAEVRFHAIAFLLRKGHSEVREILYR